MIDWQLPSDFLTGIKSFIGEITSGFWGIVLFIIAILIGTEIVFFIIELIVKRREIDDYPVMSDIAQSHARQYRAEALEREFQAFGISKAIKRIEETEVVEEAEKYRERLRKRFDLTPGGGRYIRW